VAGVVPATTPTGWAKLTCRVHSPERERGLGIGRHLPCWALLLGAVGIVLALAVLKAGLSR
jgi:hypothetical protein